MRRHWPKMIDVTLFRSLVVSSLRDSILSLETIRWPPLIKQPVDHTSAHKYARFDIYLILILNHWHDSALW